MPNYNKLLAVYIKICTNLPKTIIDQILAFLEEKLLFSLIDEDKKKLLFNRRHNLTKVDFNCITVNTREYIRNIVLFCKHNNYQYNYQGKPIIFSDFMKHQIYKRLLRKNEGFFKKIVINYYSPNIQEFLTPFFKKYEAGIEKVMKKRRIMESFDFQHNNGGFYEKINITCLNRSVFMICNRITKLFPQPVAIIIKKLIIFDFDQPYNNTTTFDGLVKDFNLITSKKKLKYVMVHHESSDKSISNINNYCATKPITVHKKKYYTSIAKYIYFSNYAGKKPGIIHLKTLSRSMEEFIYNILKKTFVPKFKLYKKVFEL